MLEVTMGNFIRLLSVLLISITVFKVINTVIKICTYKRRIVDKHMISYLFISYGLVTLGLIMYFILTYVFNKLFGLLNLDGIYSFYSVHILAIVLIIKSDGIKEFIKLIEYSTCYDTYTYTTNNYLD